MIKRWLLVLCFCLAHALSLHAGYERLVLDPYVLDFTNTPISGPYDISVAFYPSENISDEAKLFEYATTNINFSDGYASIEIVHDDALSDIVSSSSAMALLTVESSTAALGAITVSINFYSVAYGIRAYTAENVLYPYFSNITANEVFEDHVSVNNSITVSDVLTVQTEAPYVVVSGSDFTESALAISGDMNAAAFYKNGQLYKDSLSWQVNDDNLNDSGQSVYFEGDSVWVNRTLSFDDYALDVKGTVRAEEFFVNGGRLSAALEWAMTGDDIYFTQLTNKVGIGDDPIETLDIYGGLRLTAFDSDTVSSGSIYWNGEEHYFGKVNDELITLNSLDADGHENTVALFESQHSLTHDKDLNVDASESGFDLLSDEALLSISDNDADPLHIYDTSGNIVVSINNSGRIDIDGAVNADKFYLYGAPIGLRVAQGEYFLKGDITETAADIFYNYGNVSIGSWKPTYNLVLSAPLTEPSVPTIDPALTFRSEREDEDEFVFTIGINADSEGVFLMEASDELGSTSPIMAMKENYLGIGISDPKYNLHVSSNSGILVEGEFRFFDEDFVSTNIAFFADKGSRLFYNPYNASFHAGNLTDESVLNAEERAFENVGVNSIAFGLNSLAKGNFSNVLGGDYNQALGAYSTAFGSRNLVDGYFSLGLGYGAHVAHDGSFVFSQPGLYGSLDNLDDDNALAEGSLLATKVERQFLIGPTNASDVTAYRSSVGINTSNTFSGALFIKPSLLSAEYFESIDSVSSSDAKSLLASLESQGAVSEEGQLLLPAKVYFDSIYTIDTLVVTLNSSEFFDDIVDYAKDNQLTSISSENVLSMLPSDNWNGFYSYDESTLTYNTFEGGSNYRYWVSSQFSDSSDFILDSFVLFNLIDASGYVQSLDSASFCQASSASGYYEINDDVFIDILTHVTAVLSDIQDTIDTDGSIDVVVDYDTNDDGVFDDYTYGDPYTQDDLDLFLSHFEDPDSVLSVEEMVSEFIFDFLYSKRATVTECSLVTTVNMKSTTFFDYVFDRNYDGTNYTDGFTPDDFATYLTDVVYPEVSLKVMAQLEAVGFLDSDDDSDGSRDIQDSSSYLYRLADVQSVSGVPTDSVVTALEDMYNRHLITLRGKDNADAFSVASNGKAGVAVTELGAADLSIASKLTVMPSASDDRLSAQVSIFNPSTVASQPSDNESDSDEVFYDKTFVFTDNSRETAAFQMNVTGHVGIDLDPANLPFESDEPVSNDFKLRINGKAIISGLVDSDTGQEISAKPPVIVFLSELTTPNIYFTSGNVGLGTAQPMSLLHLSTMESNGDTFYPTMIFDLDETNYFNLGYPATSSNFRIRSTTASVLSSDGYSLAIGTENLWATFNVAGNVTLERLQVTENRELAESDYELVTDYLGVQALYVQGNRISASGYTWDITDEEVYIRDLGSNTKTKIGIGVSAPTTSLEVSGTIKADAFVINDNLDFKDELYVDANLFLQDQSQPLAAGYKLYVEDEDLLLKLGSVFNVSSVFSKSYGTPSPSALVAWGNVDSFQMIELDDFLFQEQDVNFDENLWVYESDDWQLNDDYVLTASAILTVNGQIAFQFSSVNYTHNLQFPNTEENIAFDFDSSIGYDESDRFYFDSFSHNFINYDVSMKANYANVKGVNIDLSTSASNNIPVTLFADTYLVGSYVDLTNVTVQESGESTSGYKYPAILLGDVSVGSQHLRDPDYYPSENILSIDGSVKATGFNITNRLIVTSMNVGGAFSVGTDKKVGVGTKSPETSLEVIGTIKTNSVNSGGVKALDYTNDYFSVADSGKVKFGVNADTSDAFVAFDKAFSSLEFPNFVFRSYDVNLTNNVVATHDISMLDINFVTDLGNDSTVSKKNIFGAPNGDPYTAIGLHVDLDSIAVDSGTSATINGVIVKTPAPTAILSSNVAVFMGGNVGIGTTQPDQEHALVVDGDFKAASSFGENLGELNVLPDYGTFDHLIVTESMVVDATATLNRLYVDTLENSSLSLNTLSLGDYNLEVTSELTVGTITVNEVATASTVSDVDLLEGKDAYLERLAVGKPLSTVHAVSVTSINHNGDIYSTELTAVSLNIASNFIANDGENLQVHSDYGGYALELKVPTMTEVFVASENDTWNAIRFDSATANHLNHVEVLLAPESLNWFIQGFQDGSSSNNYNLVFVNADAQTSSNLLVSSNGFVGIANDNPAYLFDVAGDAQFDSVNTTTLNVKEIKVIDVGALSELTTVSDEAVFEQFLTVNRSIALVTTNEDWSSSDQASLYYKEGSSSGLYFYSNFNNNAISANVTRTYNYSVGSLVYFSANEGIQPLNNLVISNNENELIITLNSSGVTESLLALRSDIPETNLDTFDSTVYNQLLDIKFAKRDASNSVLKGYSINFASTDNATDAFIGLNIDLSELEYHSEQSAGEGGAAFYNETNANKYAATMLAGTVKIGSGNVLSGEEADQALLWLDGDRKAGRYLIVDADEETSSRYDLTVVSDNLGVGVLSSNILLGTRLEINANADESALLIKNSDSDALVDVRNSVLVVGSTANITSADDLTRFNKANLYVGGLIEATGLSVDEGGTKGLEANSITFGSDAYFNFDESTGQLGLGLTEPSAVLHSYKAITADSGQVRVRKGSSMDVTSNRDVTGIHVSVTTSENNFYAGSNGASITAFDVELSELALATDGIAKGLSFESDTKEAYLKQLELSISLALNYFDAIYTDVTPSGYGAEDKILGVTLNIDDPASTTLVNADQTQLSSFVSLINAVEMIHFYNEALIAFGDAPTLNRQVFLGGSAAASFESSESAAQVFGGLRAILKEVYHKMEVQTLTEGDLVYELTTATSTLIGNLLEDIYALIKGTDGEGFNIYSITTLTGQSNVIDVAQGLNEQFEDEIESLVRAGDVYAAVFEDASLGIGTTVPDTDLQLSGTLKAKHVFIDEQIDLDLERINLAEDLSSKKVTVQGDLSASGDVDVDGILAFNSTTAQLNLDYVFEEYDGVTVNVLNITDNIFVSSGKALLVGSDRTDAVFAVATGDTVWQDITIQAHPTHGILYVDTISSNASSVSLGTDFITETSLASTRVFGDSLQLPETTTTLVTGNIGVIDDVLLFHDGIEAVDLTDVKASLSGTNGQLVYYAYNGSKSVISVNESVRLNGSGLSHELAVTGSVALLNYVGPSSEQYSAADIIISLADERDGGSGSTFNIIGTDIVVVSDSYTGTDNVVGLDVDLTELDHSYYRQIGEGSSASITDTTGSKYAAIFQSGTIRIGSSNIQGSQEADQALLWVKGDRLAGRYLIVDADTDTPTRYDVTIVSDNLGLFVLTSNQLLSAKTEINTSGSESGLLAENEAGDTLLDIRPTVSVIGSTAAIDTDDALNRFNSADLYVGAVLEAASFETTQNYGYALELESLDFGSNAYFNIDSDTTHIGLGTTAPAYALHSYKLISQDSGKIRVRKGNNVSLENDDNFGGLAIEVRTEDRNSFTGSETESIKGLSVDISNLSQDTGALIKGVATSSDRKEWLLLQLANKKTEVLSLFDDIYEAAGSGFSTADQILGITLNQLAGPTSASTIVADTSLLSQLVALSNSVEQLHNYNEALIAYTDVPTLNRELFLGGPSAVSFSSDESATQAFGGLRSILFTLYEGLRLNSFSEGDLVYDITASSGTITGNILEDMYALIKGSSGHSIYSIETDSSQSNIMGVSTGLESEFNSDIASRVLDGDIYAAIFESTGVAIGKSSASESLDINGSLKAHHLTLTDQPDLAVDSLEVSNGLAVSELTALSDLIVNGALNIYGTLAFNSTTAELNLDYVFDEYEGVTVNELSVTEGITVLSGKRLSLGNNDAGVFAIASSNSVWQDITVDLADDSAVVYLDDLAENGSGLRINSTVVMQDLNSDDFLSNIVEIKDSTGTLATGDVAVQDDLLLYFDGVSTVNLTDIKASLSGSDGQLVYYASNGVKPVITMNQGVMLDGSGSDYDLLVTGSVVVTATLESVSDLYKGLDIQLDLTEERDGSTASTFKMIATDIVLASTNYTGDDDVVGLDVDLSDLEYSFYREVGEGDSQVITDTQGAKYAALFQGGSVRLGTSNIVSTENADTSLFWIRGDRTQGRHLIVESDSNSASRYDFTVVSDSVGIGVLTSNMLVGTRAEINPESADTALIVDNSAGLRLLELRPNNAVIGGTSNVVADDELSRFNASALYVDGLIVAQGLEAGLTNGTQVEAESLSFGSDAYFNFNESTGELGLGTTSPEAVLHSYKLVDSDSGKVKVRKGSQVEVSDNIRVGGLDISIHTAENNAFAGASLASVKGLDVSLADLSLESTATVKGLSFEYNDRVWQLKQLESKVAEINSLFTNLYQDITPSGFDVRDKIMSITLNALVEPTSSTVLEADLTAVNTLLELSNAIEQAQKYNQALIAYTDAPTLNSQAFVGGSVSPEFEDSESNDQVFGGLRALVYRLYQLSKQGALTEGDLVYILDDGSTEVTGNILADMYALIKGTSSLPLYSIETSSSQTGIISVSTGIVNEFSTDFNNEVPAVDAYALVIATGSVGIGNTAPNADLVVNGAIKASHVLIDAWGTSIPDLDSAVVNVAENLPYVSTASIGGQVTVNHVQIDGLLSFAQTNLDIDLNPYFEDNDAVTVNELVISETITLSHGAVLNVGDASGSGVLNVAAPSSSATTITVHETYKTYLDELASKGSVITVSPNQDLEFGAAITANAFVVQDVLNLSSIANGASYNIGVSSGQLVYKKESSVDPYSLSTVIKGHANKLPFYISDSVLSANASLKQGSNKITAKGQFVHVNTISTDNLLENFEEYSIKFEDRSSATSGKTFFGLLVTANYNKSVTYNHRDGIYGAYVDASNLKSDYSLEVDGSAVDVDVYAAIFDGIVEIGSSFAFNGFTTNDQAGLFVRSDFYNKTGNVTSNKSMRLYAFAVSPSSNIDAETYFLVDETSIGIGTMNVDASVDPTSNLATVITANTFVKVSSTNTHLLSILDTDSKPVFDVYNGNVGVGISTPSQNFHVKPFAEGEQAFNVNNFFYVIDESVGIATSNPSAQFDLFQASSTISALQLKSGEAVVLEIASQNTVFAKPNNYAGGFKWTQGAGKPSLVHFGQALLSESLPGNSSDTYYLDGMPEKSSLMMVHATDNIMSLSVPDQDTLSDNIQTFVDSVNAILSGNVKVKTVTKNFLPYWTLDDYIPVTFNAIFEYVLDNFRLSWDGGSKFSLTHAVNTNMNVASSAWNPSANASTTNGGYDACNVDQKSTPFTDTSVYGTWIRNAKLEVKYIKPDGAVQPYISYANGYSYFTACDDASGISPAPGTTIHFADRLPNDSNGKIYGNGKQVLYFLDALQRFDSTAYPTEGAAIVKNSYDSFYDWVNTIDDVVTFLDFFKGLDTNLDALVTTAKGASSTKNVFKEAVANASYGGVSAKYLTVQHDSETAITDIMTLTDSKLGIFHTVPSVNFHIKQPEGSGQSFVFNVSDIFVIDDEGRIAIGTTETSTTNDVKVEGTIKAQSIIDAEDGTALSVLGVTLNEAATAASLSTFEIVSKVDKQVDYSGYDISIDVAADRKNGADVYGYHLDMFSDSYVSNGRYVYGLYVNVDGLVSGTTATDKYAAAFYSIDDFDDNDTKVIIDTSSSRHALHAGNESRFAAGHLKYNYPLSVYAKENEKNKDNVLGLFTSEQMFSDISMQLRFVEQSVTNSVNGSVITTNLIPRDAFASISESLMFAGDANETLYRATEVFDTMVDYGFITTVNTTQGLMGYLAVPSWNSYTDIVTSWNEVFLTTNQIDKYQYVQNLPSRNIIGVMASYLGWYVYGIEYGSITTNVTTAKYVSYNAITIASGTNPLFQSDTADQANTIARVGIGMDFESAEAVYTNTYNPLSTTNVTSFVHAYNEALIVSGDVRLGIVSSESNPAGTDLRRIYFSGAEQFGLTENDDYYSIERETNSSNGSILASSMRMRMLSSGSDYDTKIKMGYTGVTGNIPIDYFQPVMEMGATSRSGSMFQYAGIGTNDDSELLGHFMVETSVTANSTFDQHVAMLEATYNVETYTGSNQIDVFSWYDDTNSTNLSTLNILALEYSLLSGGDSDLNFMSFVANEGTDETPSFSAIGAIEGNDEGSGVQFSSTQRDYAEYLKKRDASEVIIAGDVVGVFNGEVSKDTVGADHVMVMSSSPIIVGNWPGKENEDLYGLVAFLGQAPVKVMGHVSRGDLLIPSGLEDGSAIAINEADISIDQIDVLIGRAWESSDANATSYVNAYVGQAFRKDILSKKLSDLHDDIQHYQSDNSSLKAQLQKRYEDRQNLLARLKEKKGDS